VRGTELDGIRRAFDAATPIRLRQAWLPSPEEGFAPATVRVAWRDEALLVLAELEDADIHTEATRHNQPFWELGDTFEMFLRPEGQDAYAEFHVAPNNFRLQLKFPDADWLRRTPKAEAFVAALVGGEAFRSHTWVEPEAGRWWVMAKIPALSVCDRPVPPITGSTWRFSFSRYDYTRGRPLPVISSTSPHAEPAFHRQQEWGCLRFRP
jgi:hypothetical protein